MCGAVRCALNLSGPLASENRSEKSRFSIFIFFDGWKRLENEGKMLGMGLVVYVQCEIHGTDFYRDLL